MTPEDIAEQYPADDDTVLPPSMVSSAIPDFTFNGVFFRDGGELSRKDLMRTIRIINKTSEHRVPYEGFCHSSTTFKNQLRDLLDTLDVSTVSNWARDRASKRIPWSYMLGDFQPVFLGGYVGNNLVGGYLLAAPKILPALPRQEESLIRLSCMPTPGTIFLDTEMERLTFEMEFIEFLLNRPWVARTINKTYRIDEIHIPLDVPDINFPGVPQRKRNFKANVETAMIQAVNAGMFIDTIKTDLELGLPISLTRTYHVLTKAP